MIGYYLIIFSVTFLFFLQSKSRQKIFGIIGLIILIIFGFLRYDFGVDYNTYKMIHKIVNNFSQSNINHYYLKQTLRLEKGFIILNYIFYNFQIMIGIITLINTILIYKTINYYIKINKYISIFLYLGIFQLFFYNLSSIRQSIANAIFFFSTRYIVERKKYKFLGCIILGACFHKSLILMIPIYYIGINKIFRNNKRNTLIIILVLIILLKIPFILKTLYLLLAKINFHRYAFELIKENSKISGITYLIFVINIINLLISLYYLPYKNKKEKLIYNMVIINFGLALLKILGIKALHRIENYFIIFEIIAIPYFIEKLKYKRLGEYFILLSFSFLFFIRLQKQNLESNKYKEIKIIFLENKEN